MTRRTNPYCSEPSFGVGQRLISDEAGDPVAWNSEAVALAVENLGQYTFTYPSLPGDSLRSSRLPAAARRWPPYRRLPAASFQPTLRLKKGSLMQLEFTADRTAEAPELFIHLDLEGFAALLKTVEAAMETGRGVLSAGTYGPGGTIIGTSSPHAFRHVTLTFDRSSPGRGGKMPN
jgi:hypothetical protein